MTIKRLLAEQINTFIYFEQVGAALQFALHHYTIQIALEMRKCCAWNSGQMQMKCQVFVYPESAHSKLLLLVEWCIQVEREYRYTSACYWCRCCCNSFDLKMVKLSAPSQLKFHGRDFRSEQKVCACFRRVCQNMQIFFVYLYNIEMLTKTWHFQQRCDLTSAYFPSHKNKERNEYHFGNTQSEDWCKHYYL